MSAAPRFAIVGAGAIGAYVGAALVRGGADVTLIARGAQLDALRRGGVRVESPRGDFQVAVDATDDFDAIAGAGVVVLGVKAYSLRGLAPAIGDRLDPGAAVVAAQNGIPWWYLRSCGAPFDAIELERVDPGGEIAAAIPDEHVIGCVTYCSTALVAPGVIRHYEGTRFAIGEPFGAAGPERCAAIADAFVAGGLKCPVEDDLGPQLWLKLIGNVAFNSMSALTGCTLAQLGRLPESRALLLSLLEEGAAVAAALGVELPVSLERRLEGGLAVGDHKPSTLQDLEAGKPLELDCLSGALVELAGRLDTPAPHTRAVDTCLRLLDARRQGWPAPTMSPTGVGG